MPKRATFKSRKNVPTLKPFLQVLGVLLGVIKVKSVRTFPRRRFPFWFVGHSRPLQVRYLLETFGQGAKRRESLFRSRHLAAPRCNLPLAFAEFHDFGGLALPGDLHDPRAVVV